jgi:hypothetical protein
MTNTLQKFLWSIAIFGLLAFLSYSTIFVLRNGTISPAAVIYFIEWPSIAVIGIIAFILRKLNVIRNKALSIYIFLGVANAGNAFIGAYFLILGHSNGGLLYFWLRLSATAVIALLIITDAAL